MNRRFRLTRSADFRQIYHSGKTFRSPLLIMILRPNEIGNVRIAVIAGKSVGYAVRRNRAKRLIRSALQPLLVTIPAGWDILFIARKPLLDSSFQQVQDALDNLIRRSGIQTEKKEFGTY